MQLFNPYELAIKKLTASGDEYSRTITKKNTLRADTKKNACPKFQFTITGPFFLSFFLFSLIQSCYSFSRYKNSAFNGKL